ncbi:hypothetical protein ACFOQM_13835 [Paenibacillus sp. GCM10012307]|uniref:Uncharacterized protein n=1 Tax=Paenibacillus roseus TaxID=2798579 RepID=A0A934J3X1_9BACL|nr:hypothetical protein [Paenibacillus roseus]MBJ6362370.1 hypothetical protein [Paenibacillus roseus]
MKKKIISAILSTLLTLILVLPASASSLQDTPYKLLENNVEIKDPSILIQRAINNVSDLPIENQVSREQILSDDNKPLSVTQYRTAQLLTEKQDQASGDLISTYAVTTLASYDASKTETKWDSTYSIKGHLTIYVSYVYDSHGLKYWKLQEVSGGWEVYASGVTATNKQVIYGVYGITPSSGLFQNSITQNPIASTFSYTAPTSWGAVLSTGAGNFKPNVGGNTTATLSAFGSTWTLTVSTIFA